jgi:hypothetical protein
MNMPKPTGPIINTPMMNLARIVSPIPTGTFIFP